MQDNIFIDRATIGNDNCDTLPTELALSSKENRSKEPCIRCGAVVSVPASQSLEVYCVDCRPKSPRTDSVSDASPSGDSVELTVDDILTVTCQLCRSSLLVNESKVGTQVTCPDCHSKIIVTRPKSRPKRKTGRPQPKTNKRAFDPNAELTLEKPVERPKTDLSDDLDDLDEGTDDLLSAPLPQALPEDDPLPESWEDDELSEPEEANGVPAGEQALTRRQRYERMQHRMISEGREEMRKQARQKLARKKTGGKPVASDADDPNPHRRKRRRKKKGQRAREMRSPSWVKPAFGWLRQRSLIVGWVLATGCLSVAYVSGADWSPLALLDHGYQMMTQTPLALDVRLIVNSVLLMVGSLVLYVLCGRSFAANAGTVKGTQPVSEPESETDADPQEVKVSGVFTTVHFALAWLLAGLPFLYLSLIHI